MIGWAWAAYAADSVDVPEEHAPTPLPGNPWTTTDAGRAPSVDLAEEADLQFRLGVAAYRAGDLTEALEHLLASHRLVPNRNVVFNLARTYEELGQLDSAWRYYDQYARTELDPESRAEAEQALIRLGPKVARVKVDTVPPGATVYLDRTDLGSRGQTPLTLALPPGDHELLLALDGYRATRTSVLLVTGALAETVVTLGDGKGPEAVEGWRSSSVWAGDVRLVRVEPNRCVVLGGPDTGRYETPKQVMPPVTGSVVSARVPTVGLALDLVVGTADVRTLRTPIPPTSRRALGLADAAPIHAAVFDRCVPTNPDVLASALSALPTKTRLDAVRLFTEWAAWRGAEDAPDVGEACREGDCRALADRLTRDAAVAGP